MKQPPLKFNHGFSLIELVIVMAVIGIMAMIAVPAYKNMQAKAHRKEGLALLSHYYSAAQNTRAEFGRYPGNFVQTAFQPRGRISFRLRAQDGPDIDLGINDNGCWRTQESCDCGGDCMDFRTWEELPRGNATTRGIAFPAPFAASCGGLAPEGTTDFTFSIRAAAYLGVSPNSDAWGMDHTRQLVMCQDGLE